MARALVMGIVNVTPDSFSDGGRYFSPEEALRRAVNIELEGADIIDIGAESTRPGATPLTWQEEWSRLEPVLKSLEPKSAFLSVDTYHPETAERAVKLGARMINCVYAEYAGEMVAVQRAHSGVQVVLPSSWALEGGRLSELSDFYVDPMIGFGTTREEDIRLLRSLESLSSRARVLAGVSKKRIIKKLTGEKTLGKTVGGSLAAAVWCVMKGASCVRVHDVRETVQAVKVVSELENGEAVK